MRVSAISRRRHVIKKLSAWFFFNLIGYLASNMSAVTHRDKINRGRLIESTVRNWEEEIGVLWGE